MAGLRGKTALFGAALLGRRQVGGSSLFSTGDPGGADRGDSPVAPAAVSYTHLDVYKRQVGDVRQKPLRQIVTAAADGAVASKFVEEYLAQLGG